MQCKRLAGIVAITAGDWHTVDKLDGTLTTVGNNRYGQCNVSSWRGIVAVKAGYLHTVGLKRDGTMTAVGNDKHNQCDVSGWRDIVAIAAGTNRYNQT